MSREHGSPDARVSTGSRSSPSVRTIRRAVRTSVQYVAPLQTNLQVQPTSRYGVSLMRSSFTRGSVVAGTTPVHLLGWIRSSVATNHIVAGKRVQHISRPNSLCLSPANADYSTEFCGAVDTLLVAINPDCLAAIAIQQGVYRGTLREEINASDPQMYRMTCLLAQEAESGFPKWMLFWSTVTDHLLTRLVSGYHTQTASVAEAGEFRRPELRLLIEYITEHLDSELDLSSLAGIVGCGRYHFAHKFRATLGTSPYQYIIRRRVERARHLIGIGQMSLAQIATAVGFSDQSHLHRWFRKLIGCTPGEFAANRKNVQYSSRRDQ